ncbi:Protein bicaudal D 2 [Desmophyllum pertusum]|uniref:Protein bicaudal D 2 n=1 Tax=Desmophyllum pertusum TaxID=174260 RepID=A0A9W9ZAJ7_9CNID|nr:Protein bicaudal D 2 [Desmophyllum pertusum]
MSAIDQLKSEIERLSSELQQACLEKVQAAEYGLAVLEEKQRLQEQYDELEGTLEANKQELECLREVHEQLKLEQEKRSRFGDDREESLVKESESREASYLHKITDLESDVRQARKAERDALIENERLCNQIANYAKEIEQLLTARKYLEMKSENSNTENQNTFKNLVISRRRISTFRSSTRHLDHRWWNLNP